MQASSEGLGASMIRSTSTISLQRFAHMADFGIMAAADELQQDGGRSRIGQLERIEIVERRKFLVAADRQPIVEHARVAAPLGTRDRAERSQQRVRLRPLGRLHARIGRSHPSLRVNLCEQLVPLVLLRKG